MNTRDNELIEIFLKMTILPSILGKNSIYVYKVHKLLESKKHTQRIV